MTTPEATCETIELCPPPPRRTPRRPAKAAVTPPPEAQEVEVAEQPVLEPTPERGRERAVARPRPRPRAAPLVPRARLSPERARGREPREAPNMLARNVALGVGGTGLMASAVALGANVEARSDVGYAIGGVALGVGIIGLGTAGILHLMQDDDSEKSARVTPTGDGIRVSF